MIGDGQEELSTDQIVLPKWDIAARSLSQKATFKSEAFEIVDVIAITLINEVLGINTTALRASYFAGSSPGFPGSGNLRPTLRLLSCDSRHHPLAGLEILRQFPHTGSLRPQLPHSFDIGHYKLP
jgi:hypothetical protein